MSVEVIRAREHGWFPCRRCGVPLDAARGRFLGDGPFHEVLPKEQRRAHTVLRCGWFAGAVHRTVTVASCPMCPGALVEALEVERVPDPAEISVLDMAVAKPMAVLRVKETWELGHFVPAGPGRPVDADLVEGRWHRWSGGASLVDGDLRMVLVPGAGWSSEVP